MSEPEKALVENVTDLYRQMRAEGMRAQKAMLVALRIVARLAPADMNALFTNPVFQRLLTEAVSAVDAVKPLVLDPLPYNPNVGLSPGIWPNKDSTGHWMGQEPPTAADPGHTHYPWFGPATICGVAWGEH